MSDIETSDLTLGRRSIPDRFASERKDDAQDSPTPRPEREGLPASYRMRADAHYVEQLDAAPVVEGAVGLERGAARQAAPQLDVALEHYRTAEADATDAMTRSEALRRQSVVARRCLAWWKRAAQMAR